MVDTPYTTINKAFYLEKDLKFYAMLFDTTGGSKISSEEKKKKKNRKKGNFKTEKGKRTGRENVGQGFPKSQVVCLSLSHTYAHGDKL